MNMRLPISIFIMVFASYSCSNETLEKKTDFGNRTMETLNSKNIYSKVNLTNEDYTNLDDNFLSDINSELSLLHEDSESPPEPSAQLLTPSYVSPIIENQAFLIGLVSHGYRKWEVTTETNVYLAIRHHKSAKIWLNAVLLNNRRGMQSRPSKTGTSPTEFLAKSWSAGFSKVNIFEHFPKNLPLGEYTGTVLYYDLPSISRSFVLYDESNALSKTPSKTTPLGVEKIDIKATKENIILNISFTQPRQGTWKGNIIALKLDEKPIVIPVSKELGEADAKSITLEIPFQENNQLKEGEYQMYVDVGDRMEGPFEIHIAP